MLITPNNIQLQFVADVHSPVAYFSGEPVSLRQFKRDVLETTEHILKASGETLITTPGRYTFSVALLASWMAQRAVVLPPDAHQVSSQRIRDQHKIGFECNSQFNNDLLNKAAIETTNNISSWSIDLPSMHTAVSLYTSGSTGLPCVVKKSLLNLFQEAECVSQAFDWSDGAIVGTVPAQHLYGLTFTILLPWVLGVPLVDEVPFYPQDISRVIAQSGAASLISVPAHFNVLLKEGFESRSLFYLSATAPLAKQTAVKWYQRNKKKIWEVYGSTETGVIGLRCLYDDLIWTAFKGVQLSTDSSELTVNSAFIHPQLGKDFHTADEVDLKDENRFYLLGRCDGLVKIAGKRISLTEVEQALLACSSITDAAVIVVDVQGMARDKAIWAAVVADPDHRHTVAAIRQELGRRIEATGIPKRFVFLDKLPRNSNGKITRLVLEGLFSSNEAVNV